MSHMTKVNGTAYEITGGKTKVNGTAYDISKGITKVNGTAYEISFVHSLQDYSWDEISEISASGQGSNYFAIGDCKGVALNGTVGTLTLKNTSLQAYIIGFDHNSTIEGNGITFGTFKKFNGSDTCLTDTFYNSDSANGTKCFNMNHWGESNYGGWAGSDIRYAVLGSTDKAPSGYKSKPTSSRVGYDPSNTCATNPVSNTLMAALPLELRKVMLPIKKYTDNKGGSGDTSNKGTIATDYLPLLSMFEVFGYKGHASTSEEVYQKQYEYYANGNSKIKQYTSNSNSVHWLLRSPSTLNAKSFCYINESGTNSYRSSIKSSGLAPIFKV